MEKVKKYIIDNKELMKEWDWEKNKNMDPNTLTYGSNQKAWWKCKLNHSYESSIANKSNGKGCPFCANQKVLAGFNDLLSQYPEIAKEWNYNKNKMRPDEITAKSGRNVWWICEKGHEWKSIVGNRTKNGKRGCPICANRVLLKGFNDLETVYPELLKEWDYKKNKVKPNELFARTTDKVWWKCEKGHEWCATVVSRAKNHNCPICNSGKQTSISEKAIVYYLNKANVNLIENYKIEKKEIDIFIPSLKIGIEYDGQYFHKSLKKDIDKNKLCEMNNIKLIRIREPELPKLNSTSIDFRINELTHDHSYMNDIIKQLLEYLHIYNVQVDVEKDFNEIYSLFQKGERKDSIINEYPELIKEWDYNKNTHINPEYVSKGVHINVWWKCQKCGFSWKAAVYSRASGSGCPKCSGRQDVKKPTKLKIGENDFQNEHPELLKEWNYDKNKIKPTELTSGSNLKVWWICKLGHSYEASVVNRIKGTGCPYCANLKILKGFNDLATTNPSLSLEWNYEKNDITPNDVVAGTHLRVWWKCKKGHEWQASIASRNKGIGCPICSGRLILKGYNDLATTNPDLIEKWDFEKNEISPYDIGKGSHAEVWWKCSKGHSYKRLVYNQVTRNSKCPICKEK